MKVGFNVGKNKSRSLIIFWIYLIFFFLEIRGCFGVKNEFSKVSNLFN